MTTLKQDAVIERLPANGFNLAKTMAEVGYAPGSCVGGDSRLALRKITKKYYDKDFIRKEYKRLYKTCDTEKDRSNQSKVLDSMARTEAMFTDKTENKNTTELTISEKSILDKYLQEST